MTAADTYYDQIHVDAVLIQARQRVARLKGVGSDVQVTLGITPNTQFTMI